MSAIEEVGIIIRDVAKGLASVISRKDERPSEYLILHYCSKCHHYHVAGTAPDGFPSSPRKYSEKPEYVYSGTRHYCKKCGRYHKAD